MSLLTGLLLSMPSIPRVVLVLSLVAAAGLTLGQLTLRGIGLGIGGVLFAGIAAGHVAALAGVTFDPAMMDFIRDFGLVLFVYTIGIQVGPGFFAALRKSGLALNGLALLMVLSSVALAAALHGVLKVPLPAALGIFSGAVTNAPALAASQQVLKEVGAPAEALAVPGLAFAVTYPFGIAGNLLAMALLRLVFRIDVAAEAAAFEATWRGAGRSLASLDLRIGNPTLIGVRLGDLSVLEKIGVVASRMRRDGKLCLPDADIRLADGDVLHLVGPPASLEQARLLFGGVEVEAPLTTKGSELRWERLVVTSTAAFGRALGQLGLKDRVEVVVSRVNRAGIELVPSPALRLQFGDILTVIGRPDDIRAASGLLGNSERRLQRAELTPIFLGLALGAVFAAIPVFLPGMPAPLRLGMAGGPLVAAILLGRLGSAGPLVWFMPPAASQALREIGIVLFLAVLGVASGARFVETLASGIGLPWMAYGVVVTFVPLVLTGLAGRLLVKLDLFALCGLLAGAQTNPPGLAYANNLGQPEAPALAYTTVYPLAMCLRILAPQVLVLLLW